MLKVERISLEWKVQMKLTLKWFMFYTWSWHIILLMMLKMDEALKYHAGRDVTPCPYKSCYSRQVICLEQLPHILHFAFGGCQVM